MPCSETIAADREADRADLVRADPHAGVLAPAMRGHAEARARGDDGGFEVAHERNDFAKAREPADRVDDQLTRAVIRHVAAALDGDDVDAALGERLVREQHVLSLRPAAERNHRRMLDDDPRVGFASLAHRVVQAVLEIPDFAVRPRSQIEQSSLGGSLLPSR